MKIRKLVTFLLVVVMSLSLCSCSKITEKIAEKGMEKVMENATGADIDITKDGASISVEGSSIQSGENLKWPKDAMGELPEPNAKITFIMANDDKKGGSVTFNEMELKDAQKYAEKLKELGFKDGMSMEDADGIVFSGKTDNGALVNFTYNPTAKEGAVVYGLEK